MSEYMLEMKNIIKEYSGNRVLKGVNLQVKRGEIHALLGENGAGKSTLMNILFGMPVIHATGGFEGEVWLDGEKVSISSPEKAMELGIGMVHQEFMLIPGFNVAENIKLNREITRHNVVSRFMGEKLKTLDMDSMRADARKALDRLGLSLDEKTIVSELPVGYKQFVEIAREIDKTGVKLLVFDEPTAVLTESEADTLLKAMKMLSDSGIAILFITHRLDEVMNVADNVTIMKDGEWVETVPKTQTTVLDIAQKMVGRKIEAAVNAVDHEDETHEILIEISDLYVDMPGEECKGVTLQVRKGEILGLGGLAGQGKIGVANGIVGLYPARGTVRFKGQEHELNNPTAALKNRMAFVSEDRRGTGLLLTESIEANISVTAMQAFDMFLKKYGFFTQQDDKAIRENAMKYIQELDIRCTGPKQYAGRLSGGNQQKVCLAKALTLEPEVIWVSEPTRGIDIGAKKLVLDMLVKLNAELGLTVIMTSSELQELRSICHRIAIVTEGKIEGILKPSDSDADFGLMMAGEYHKYHGKEAAN